MTGLSRVLRASALFFALSTGASAGFGAEGGTSAADAAPPTRYKIQDVVMSLKRTSCYGECPVYSIEVRGDGHGTYFGVAWVRTAGEKKFLLDRKTVVALYNEVLKVHFTKLDDDYTETEGVRVAANDSVQSLRGMVSDDAGIVLTLRIGSYSKTIKLNWTCGTKDLISLASRFDELTDSARWVKGE